MKPFEIVETERLDNGPTILALKGYLDAHTVSDFESFMDQKLEQGQVHCLLDISGLNYMSSAGIGAIMSLTQRLRRAHGDLVLLRTNEKILRILEKLGFTKIFRMADSREEGEKLLNL